MTHGISVVSDVMKYTLTDVGGILYFTAVTALTVAKLIYSRIACS